MRIRSIVRVINNSTRQKLLLDSGKFQNLVEQHKQQDQQQEEAKKQ